MGVTYVEFLQVAECLMTSHIKFKNRFISNAELLKSWKLAVGRAVVGRAVLCRIDLT
jgi:hypothetical protein